MSRPRLQVKLPREDSSVAPEGVYTNRDMDPTPPKDRTWGSLSWLSFWFAATCDPAYWEVAGSLISLGLDWRSAIGVVIFGNTAIATVIGLNGVVGANLRVPFPVAIRSAFGYHFAWFPIASRIVLAWFWYGIVSLNGAYALTLCIAAIWPSYDNVPNGIPESQGITTQEFCSYFLYWLIQLPFFFIHPRNLKWFFALKAVIVPIVALGTLGYMVNRGGSGPLVSSTEEASGRSYAQAWLLGLASVTGNWATLSVNIPDFTRYSTRPNSQWWQVLAIPLWGLAVSLCAIFSASASINVYGEALWTPFSIIEQWDSRAARFFAGFGWIIASIGSNITANSLSAGNDLTTLFPKYINITRGQIITSLIGGWAMVPWKILATAIAFLNFMAAYAVVMGPIAACLTVDYWLVKRQGYDIRGLYDPYGRYRAWNGINWRALLTLALVVPFFLPGMIESIDPDVDVGGIFWLYCPGFFISYVIGGVVFYVLNLVKPHRESMLDEDEGDASTPAASPPLDMSKEADKDSV